MFDTTYPAIARFVQTYGWIELGYDAFNMSFSRAFTGGGTAWEGQYAYPGLEAALRDLEAGLARWLVEEMGEAPGLA